MGALSSRPDSLKALVRQQAPAKGAIGVLWHEAKLDRIRAAADG